MRNWISSVLILLVLMISPVFGQVDQFGALDHIYLDHVQAQRGKEVQVGVYMTNDEPVTSVSVPLVYNPDYLTLTSVSFAGSRGAHIANKLVAPEQVSSANGQFLTGIVAISEAPIAAGDGLLFTATFLVAADAPTDNALVVDSLFYPPGGEMLLIAESGATIIRPDFSSGSVEVLSGSQPPVFTGPTDVYVSEGDSLKLPVSARDLNGDPIQLKCTRTLPGAVFSQSNGEGLFRWKPDFLGANSADGSPFTVQFWASNGTKFSSRDVKVYVINKNRKPTIVLTDSVAVTAGSPLSVDITYSDPDYDTTMLTIANAPTQSEIGYSGAHPTDGIERASFEWNTAYADSGKRVVKVIATDSHGAADTADLLLHVLPAVMYEFNIVDTSMFPSGIVYVDVKLTNLQPLSGFSMLVHADPSVLGVLSVQNTGTRTAGFASFGATINYLGIAGDVLIQGTAGAQPLAVDTGVIFRIRITASSNIAYSGLSIPMSVVSSPANSVTDAQNVTVSEDQISYGNGSIFIKSLGTVLIGDINLNEIPYDVGDAIYFIQFFLNPFIAPMNPLQLANSDANGDNIVPTVADLVTIIRVLAGDADPIGKSVDVDNAHVSIQLIDNADGSQTVQYSSDIELGGILLQGTAQGEASISAYTTAQKNMTLDMGRNADEERLLVYSMEGHTLPSGANTLLTIPAGVNFSLGSVELSSTDGQVVELALSGGFIDPLPKAFALHQNYPNPFNPDTHIDFDIAKPARVQLAVYNLLGQKIRTLADAEFPAGHHTVLWDGHDENGGQVSSGVYFYRLDAASESFTRKMMLVK